VTTATAATALTTATALTVTSAAVMATVVATMIFTAAVALRCTRCRRVLGPTGYAPKVGKETLDRAPNGARRLQGNHYGLDLNPATLGIRCAIIATRAALRARATVITPEVAFRAGAALRARTAVISAEVTFRARTALRARAAIVTTEVAFRTGTALGARTAIITTEVAFRAGRAARSLTRRCASFSEITG